MVVAWKWGVLFVLGLYAKSERRFGSGTLSNRWYLQMCHRQMRRHGDERVEICCSLYLSLPFLLWLLSCISVFHPSGGISSPQELLFPGTWLLWWHSQRWWQAQRHQIRQVPAYTSSMHAPSWQLGRSLAKFASQQLEEGKGPTPTLPALLRKLAVLLRAEPMWVLTKDPHWPYDSALSKTAYFLVRPKVWGWGPCPLFQTSHIHENLPDIHQTSGEGAFCKRVAFRISPIK